MTCHRVLTLACLLALAGCASSGNTAPSQAAIELWALPADPMGLARAAGLEPLTVESLEHHVHAHLDVFMDGRPVLVPGGIGIDIDNPAVKRFDEPGGVGYGGIAEPCDAPCISPLHTHGPDGVIHTESPTAIPNTLGEFLIEWDVALPANARVYVDGQPHAGDAADIELTDRLEIAIVIGSPPSVIPSEYPANLES